MHDVHTFQNSGGGYTEEKSLLLTGPNELSKEF